MAQANSVSKIESLATRKATRCGTGSMVWRVWGDARPLVLLHGASGSWTHWIRNIAPLAKRFRLLSDTYFCNFSLFQSMPDSWAVKQLFPIMPIHRLNEEPSHHGILGDISCDSDGKVDQFIDRRDVKKTLPLHTFNGEPYILATFLVGAYQEILGDLHNLFGDTNAVHVQLDEKGAVVIDALIRGDTVREVLDYVQFKSTTLAEQFRRDVETAVREGRIGYEESGVLLRFYEDGLNGYTYLEQ